MPIIIVLVLACTLLIFIAVCLYYYAQKNYDDNVIRLKEWISNDRGGEVLEFRNARDNAKGNSMEREHISVRLEHSYISSTDLIGHNPSL